MGCGEYGASLVGPGFGRPKGAGIGGSAAMDADLLLAESPFTAADTGFALSWAAATIGNIESMKQAMVIAALLINGFCWGDLDENAFRFGERNLFVNLE